MLLRLTLVIAILAGLGALYFVHFPIQEKINTLAAERDDARTKEQQARDSETKARSAEKKAREDLMAANKELAARTEALQTTTARLTEQEARGNDLNEKLTTAQGELNTAQQELAAWRALGVPAEQVRTMKAQLNQVAEEREALAGENKILERTNNELQRKLDQWLGVNPDPKMTAGLKGSVIAVDPRYDFVVLDIGGNQGVVENGKLLVSRDGKLVARVRITRVEPDRSVANIVEGEKYGEILEGDQVIY